MIEITQSVLALIGLLVVVAIGVAGLVGDRRHMRTCPQCGHHGVAREFGLDVESVERVERD